jgi:hypothetical protein
VIEKRMDKYVASYEQDKREREREREREKRWGKDNWSEKRESV